MAGAITGHLDYIKQSTNHISDLEVLLDLLVW